MLDKPISPLRQRMIDDMTARRFKEKVQKDYVRNGEAGTVYLCHPFLIHAAQKHKGAAPRFMTQPPLAPAVPFCLERADAAYSPVEVAIRQALRD